MRDPVELDHLRILTTLLRHEVAFVVIGGFAAVLYGSILATDDLDITPATSEDNLRRLTAALHELDAMLLAPGLDEPVPAPIDEMLLRRMTTLTLRTSAGDLDIAMRPDAPHGSYDYEQMARNAILIDLPPEVPVADLDDVIASKEAAGRDKDRVRLPELYRLRQALRQPPA
jgi:hypothetical protein